MQSNYKCSTVHTKVKNQIYFFFVKVGPTLIPRFAAFLPSKFLTHVDELMFRNRKMRDITSRSADNRNRRVRGIVSQSADIGRGREGGAAVHVHAVDGNRYYLYSHGHRAVVCSA